MSTSNPKTGQPAPKPPIAAASPLLPVARKKAPARRNRGAVAAASAVVVLLVAAAVWWMTHRTNSSAPVQAATLTREPDPPIVPPPAREALRIGPNELPAAGSNLAASLEIIKRNTVDASETESAPPVNPRVARWEMRFPPGATVETYGHQLDALGIELGAIGGGDLIAYAGGFSKQPSHRFGAGADEHRAYLVWRSGALANLDAALMFRAKVPTANRLIVHFLPPELEAKLEAEEREFAAPRDVAEVRRTAFALVPVGDRFEFKVAEQEYFSGEIKTDNPKPLPGVKLKPEVKAPAAKLP